MGQLEAEQLDRWGQKQVNRAQENLDAQNDMIAELGTDVALTACSSVPGVGIVCDFASLGRSVWKKDWAGAAMDLFGFVPVFGDAGKAAAKGADILETADDLRRAQGVAQEVVNQARRVVNGGADALRGAARAAGEMSTLRRAAARRYWAQQNRRRLREIQDAYRKCNDAACRRARREEMHELRRNPVGAGRLPREGGAWRGTPGNGTWVPDADTPLGQALTKYQGIDGIEFRNGFPDFSPFVKTGPDGRPASVEIPNMQGNNRGADGDFGQAREALREQSGESWTKSQEKGYTWHHSEDGTTMLLVDRDIHGNTAHQGGASMMRDQATF
jgi:hypothetical protein